MLQVKRQKDKRVIKSILHRIADIPGGVTINTSELGGKSLFEGTPIGPGSDGMYHVQKTALIVTTANATATDYEVAKGHHFKTGDYFATESCVGKQITAIDKSDPAKDVITLSATLGAEVKSGTCAFLSNGAAKTVKYKANSVAGSNEDVEEGDNLFVSAWLHAVVRRGNAPVVNDTIESTMKGVSYII